MQIKTIVLQNLIKKVSKMGTNKNLGITEYYNLVGEHGKLSIVATDGVNYIEASVKEECEDINVIIQAETFAKIIDKTTKEFVDINVEIDHVVLKGNGTYKIPIYVGESYPTPDYSKFDTIEGFKVGIDDIKSIGIINKSAVSTSPNGGALNGYLMTPNGVVTTDEKRICFNDRVRSTEDILLSKELVTLIGTITDLDVVVRYNEGQIYIESETTKIFGNELEGKETYPDTSSILDQFNNVVNRCRISKSVVIKALERIALFVSPFDKYECSMIAEDNTIQFETFEGSFEEVHVVEKLDEFIEVIINSINFKELLNGLSQEEVNLGFVEDQFITLEQPHVKIVMSTCE